MKISSVIHLSRVLALHIAIGDEVAFSCSDGRCILARLASVQMGGFLCGSTLRTRCRQTAADAGARVSRVMMIRAV